MELAGEHVESDVDERLREVAARWPLVGRTAMLSTIADHIRNGTASGVVLTGPAGIGKTQLARAAVRQADVDCAEEWAVGTEAGREVPLGAFASLLPGDAGRPDHLLHWAAASILERAGSSRLILGVDDAHLLDTASAALVHQFAVTRRAFVVVTVRSGETVPPEITGLWKDEIAPRLEVGALELADVRALLTGALGGTVEDHTVRRLADDSEGNPLFLHELVLSGLETGSLSERDGVWRWRGPAGGSGRLVQIVDARLRALAPDRRRALELLAFAEPLGVHDFEELVGIDVVDELERRRMIHVERDGRREQTRIAHPLYGETLRSAARPDEATELRRDLAERIEKTGMRRWGDVLQVARWRLAIGDEVDTSALVEAAWYAEAALDFELGERLARAAVESGGGDPAAHALASMLRDRGRPEEAEEVWSTLRAEAADEHLRAEYDIARANNLFFGLGRAASAHAVLDEVLDTAVSASHRHEAAGLHAIFELYEGRPEDALASARRVLDRSDVDPLNRLNAVVAAAPALAFMGQQTQAVDMVDAALPDAMTLPGDGLQVTGILLAARFLALTLGGRADDAVSLAEYAYETAIQLRAHDGIAAFSCALGQAHVTQGQVDNAIARLDEAAALLREHDRNRFLPWVLGELSYAYSMAGDLPAAHAAYAEADALRPPAFRMFLARIELARAWIAAASGKQGEAVELALASARWCESVGHVVLAGYALHDVARLGEPGAAVRRMAVLAENADSALVVAMRDHVAALATRDARQLDEAATRFGDLGAFYFAAEAAASASKAWEAVDAGRAMASAASARSFLTRCPGARPKWLSTLPQSEPLTERELEVAALAAAGHSSRSIADRLFVSVRTVDNHLHRTYSKLGVKSRDELARILPATLPATE